MLIPTLINYLLKRLSPELVSHDRILEDELWVKLGGDEGHGSFKFNMQVCNVLHPNSPFY